MDTTTLLAKIPFLPQTPEYRAGFLLLTALALALVIRLFFKHFVRRLTRSTDTDLDDVIADHLKKPCFWSVLAAGVWLASMELNLHPTAQFALNGVIATIVLGLWSSAALRSVKAVLDALSRNVDRFNWIQPKTVPLLDAVSTFLVVGFAIYFFCVVWSIPLTHWLASAGIVGLVVGLAAKDSLSNLFAGIFILADAPYKKGDFVNLDGGLRGEVQEIGIRSTRILTRDDIEVTVPNSVIASARIINETGGPWDKMRVRVKVSAAYGSDIDQVRDVLLSCVEGAPYVTDEPSPRVRFRSFGDSGLDFELLAWVDQPLFRGRVLDDLNRKVYMAFGEAGIEIPYPKQDVYVKELPRRGGDV